MGSSSEAEQQRKDNEYFQHLVNEAPYQEGLHTNIETLEDIEWLDLELLQKAKPFFLKHRLVFSMTTGIAALFGIPFRNISWPFMQTGTLALNSERTLKRTVKHVTHFVEWFTHGHGDPRVYTDIQRIKKMHAYLSKSIRPYEPPADEDVPDHESRIRFKEALRLDLEELGLEDAFHEINSYNPPVYLSQFDMVIIQLDLLAPFILPDLHGICLPGEEEGMRAFLHHWAIVGRLLGVKDQFNLALHATVPLCKRILYNLLSCMMKMDLSLSSLLEAHLDGVGLYFHFPGSAMALAYVLISESHPDFKGTNLLNAMGYKDRVAARVLKTTFWAVQSSDWMKGLVRYTGTKFCGLTSTRYHKLSRGDKLKLPIEFV